MITKIKQILATVPLKQMGNAIKKHPELYSWLLAETQGLTGEPTITERAYAAVNNITNNLCERGQRKTFRSYSEGYKFCGPAGKCECARQSVSQNVSLSKSKDTPEKRLIIQAKREQTNLNKYGVTNSGQTAKAIQAHQEFYSNSENVKQINEQVKQTTLEKYGVANAMQSPEIRERAIETLQARYGVRNPLQNPEIAAKTVATKALQYTEHRIAKRNFPRFSQMVRENFGLEVLMASEDYIGIGHRPALDFRCISCGHTFNKRFDYASLPRCRVCFPPDITYKSNGEISMLEFVSDIYKGSVISGDRSIINPYEIDIYLPELNIGIEYCGLYWHSELGGKKSWNYHERKWKAAMHKNITLFTFFEDEWLTKRKIVEDIIRSKTGSMMSKIFARKCDIVQLDKQQAEDFFDNHHLLGSPGRISVSFGLVYPDHCVAAMSFVREKENNWQLSRYASQGNVVGGAGKLLSAFVNEYHPKNIITFSDNRYSNGKLYQVLGFEKHGIVPPMQQYLEAYSVRHDKRSMNKNNIAKLYPDSDMTGTEWELLQRLNYDRIWDCGKIRWIKSYQ
jgi:hypothetical protein